MEDWGSTSQTNTLCTNLFKTINLKCKKTKDGFIKKAKDKSVKIKKMLKEKVIKGSKFLSGDANKPPEKIFTKKVKVQHNENIENKKTKNFPNKSVSEPFTQKILSKKQKIKVINDIAKSGTNDTLNLSKSQKKKLKKKNNKLRNNEAINQTDVKIKKNKNNQKLPNSAEDNENYEKSTGSQNIGEKLKIKLKKKGNDHENLMNNTENTLEDTKMSKTMKRKLKKNLNIIEDDGAKMSKTLKRKLKKQKQLQKIGEVISEEVKTESGKLTKSQKKKLKMQKKLQETGNSNQSKDDTSKLTKSQKKKLKKQKQLQKAEMDTSEEAKANSIKLTKSQKKKLKRQKNIEEHKDDEKETSSKIAKKINILKDIISTAPKEEEEPLLGKKVKKELNLREKMLEQLKSARFRMLNEEIYTNNGADAMKYFKKNPEEFQIYHEGYRQQVSKWPINPVDVIIKNIKKM